MKFIDSTTLNVGRTQLLITSRLCWMVALAIGSACPPCAAIVVDATWDGGGGNTNWDDPDNWDVTDLMGNPVLPDNHPGFDPTREYNVIIDNNPGVNRLVEVFTAPFTNFHDFNNLRVDAGDVLSLPGGGLYLQSPTVQNNGLIAVGTISPSNSIGAGTLTVSAPVTTFTGSGTLSLAVRFNSQLKLGQGISNGEIVNDLFHTINGAGRIHSSGLTLTNLGTIDANTPLNPTIPVANPNVLHIDATVTNLGVMQATNGGTLDLRTGSVTNTSHEIVAEHASTVEIGLNGVTLQGGTFRTVGTGIIKIYGAGHVAGSTRFEDITLSSGSHMQLVKGSSQSVGAQGTFTNNGLVEQRPEAPMILLDDLTLNGTGVFRMQFGPTQVAIFESSASRQLTNDVGHTIEGTGTMNNVKIDNRGLISANVRTTHADRDLAIANAGSMNSNSGTIRATNNARLFLQNVTFTNTGTFEALNGGWIGHMGLTNLSAGTLTGGTYRSIDDGSGTALNVFGTPVSTIAAGTTVELSGPNSVITFGNTNLHISLQNNSGTLKLSSGRLFNMGSNGYTQSGTGTIQIGLAPSNSSGKLATTGTATLDGTLNVAFVNGFLPVSGNSFDILDWGARSGTFATVQLPTLEAGLSWDSTQLYTIGVISIIGSTALPGDFNHDNAVDAADYVVWRKTNGTTAGFNLWRANFGIVAGSGTSPNSVVPEPVSAGVLLLGAVLIYGSVAQRYLRILSTFGFSSIHCAYTRR